MNSSIALGVRDLQVPDPVAGMHKALTLQHLMGQNDLQQQQIADAPADAAAKARLAALQEQGAQLGNQGKQQDIENKNHERAVQMAQAVMSTDEASRPTVFKQLRQWVIQNGDVNAQKNLPEEWNPQLAQGFQALIAGAVPPANAMERADIRAGAPMAPGIPPVNGTPVASPTLTALSGAPGPAVDATSGALTRAPSIGNPITDQPQASPIGEALMSPQTGPVAPVAAPAPPPEQQMPQVESQSTRITSDHWRGEGERLREIGLKRGSKELLSQSKQAFDEAARIEDAEARDLNRAEQIRLREEAQANRLQAKKSRGTDDANKLRDDFTKASKVFVDTRDAYTRISDAAQDPSAAGDMALIFNYMKMLDPGSTVREGEFATAQNSTGVEGRVRSYYNNVIRGERLNVEQRGDFVNRAEKLFTGQLENHKQLEKQFKGIASRNEINPDDVVVDYRPVLKRRASDKEPTAGQVPPASDRKSGQVYMTPKGKLKWTGTGWVQP